MKISGVPSEPFSALRRPRSIEGGASAAGEPAATDQVQFLGVPESELTPQVQAAIAMLAMELETLRGEVKRLKAQLALAEAAADADPLTGVTNRRAFLRELKRIAALVQRYGTPAALIYFDLDGLKTVNDHAGHAAGDAVLRAVSERLSAHVRESDVVGRIGGDEFAVALAHADVGAANAKARALAALIAGEAIATGEAEVSIGTSWGVVAVDPALDAEALLAAADAVMFAMKRSRYPAATGPR